MGKRAKGKRGDHLWLHGQFAGYRTYRHGVGRVQKPVRIYKGKDKAGAIEFLLNFMKDWRASPFEHEGAAVAGIRSVLCLKGYPFVRAEFEALALVRECLQIMNADRPTWQEGQPEFSDSRANCLRCGGFICESDQFVGRRFCSDSCAKSLMLDRRKQVSRRSAFAHDLARQEYRERTAVPRVCKGCGELFTSRTTDRDYCTNTCFYRSITIVKTIQCSECFTEFQQKNVKQTCCSRRCANAKALRLFREKTPEQSCGVCSRIFRAKRVGQIYCSKVCARSPEIRAAEYRTRMERLGPKAVEVKCCAHCNVEFEPAQTSMIFCSESCRRKREKLRERERYVPKSRETACAVCGCKFMRNGQRDIYCSDPCKLLARRLSAKPRDRRKVKVLTVAVFDSWFSEAA